MQPSPYTIALWTADANRLLSITAAHLLRAGLDAANRGRVDDEIPVAVGAANSRTWPVFSRATRANGPIFRRDPVVLTAERYDYLLTFTSFDRIDSGRYCAPTIAPRVINCGELVAALESVSPQSLTKDQVLSLFDSVSRVAQPITKPDHDEVELGGIAENCLQLVRALSG